MKAVTATLIAVFSSTVLAHAQTKIGFATATDPSGFVDEAQKARTQAVKDLALDFTRRAKKDGVSVVGALDDADVAITVLRMAHEATTSTSRTLEDHLFVELRAGPYVTMIDGWSNFVQTAEDHVGRQIRRWLKDNRERLKR